MADADEIIVLDDDDDDEEPPHTSEAKASPGKTPPQSNGKNEDSKNNKKGVIQSAENKKLFEEFGEYCSKLTSDNPEVITFLQTRYTKANPSYLSSVEFRNTLGRCLTRVQNKRTKVFVYINELCTALKANSQKRKVSLHIPAPAQPALEEAQCVNDKEEEIKEKPERKRGSKRQIRYLENLLRIYSQEIQKLQEKEMSVEDLEDEDSSYIQESRLKRKLLRIFDKLCELKDCPSLTGRVIEQRIQYRGTRYPEVNRRLEKFINISRDIFPDYGDVLREVERANEKHNLGLSRKLMQGLAQDAFRELGNKLQDRRHLDMVYNFGSHLTDSFKNVNDPALQDSSLARNLRDNRKVATARLDDIIKKYAELQDDGEVEETKRKKESEMPSTSKDDKVSQRSRQTPSPEQVSEEEEEESDDSDTDIEEELKQSQQIEDGEGGEDEEEESPGDQENEADQNMDIASDPQVFSSAGEEDSDKEEEDDIDYGEEDIIQEVEEEAMEQESSPASTLLSHDKESQNTSIESEGEALPSDSPGLLVHCDDTPTTAEIENEHSVEQEDCVNQSITSGETSVEEYTEVEHESGGLAQVTAERSEKNAIENGNVLLECKSPAGKIELTGEHADVQNNLLPAICSSIEKNDGDVEPFGEDLADDTSQGGSGDARTVAEIEESSPSEVSRKECLEGVYPEEPCVDSRTSIDTEVHRSEGCTTTGEEPVCVDTSVIDDLVVDSSFTKNQEPSSSDTEHSDEITQTSIDALDENICENNTDSDRSPLGNSNGVDVATEMQKSSPKLNKHKTAHRDSIKPRLIKQERSPCRKRKKIPSSSWTENGVTKCNGSDQVEGQAKRAKTDCSHTSLSSSSDPDSDNNLTLDLVGTCSPPGTPTRPSEQANKSHASTQCDPDEVIVLSD
ncbi:death domain-associated protein 6 isoform X3 [Mixophyes fleayi]|uniref:death domain-associated protein 6 isoform X3 n=1 Tax=Mixophyes fleayi TaxID=3061075 RepID=UPI003F4DEF00